MNAERRLARLSTRSTCWSVNVRGRNGAGRNGEQREGERRWTAMSCARTNFEAGVGICTGGSRPPHLPLAVGLGVQRQAWGLLRLSSTCGRGLWRELLRGPEFNERRQLGCAQRTRGWPPMGWAPSGS